ncbi:MAG: hypothetical protein ACLR8Y_22980 [Alistipes indistinctus]
MRAFEVCDGDGTFLAVLYMDYFPAGLEARRAASDDRVSPQICRTGLRGSIR